MATSKIRAGNTKTTPANAARSEDTDSVSASKAKPKNEMARATAPASSQSVGEYNSSIGEIRSSKAKAKDRPKAKAPTSGAHAPNAPAAPIAPKSGRKMPSPLSNPTIKVSGGKPIKAAAAKRGQKADKSPIDAKAAAVGKLDLAVEATNGNHVAPARPGVTVFQIYFDPAHRTELDSAFVPYDNSSSRDPLLEFAVFERLSRDEGVRLAPLWGAVSWRFGRKTGFSGKAWMDQITSNPGYDLYFCNPEPENEGLYANQWHRGITAHPGFRELSAVVLRAAGHDAAHLDAITPSSLTSSCNYFVGSSAFWAAYIPFVRGVVDNARRKLPADVLSALDSAQGDAHGLHGGVSYWPFIVERLLPLFLKGPGQTLKVYKVPLSAAEAKLNAHIKRLREMKDVAHRTRSLWLHSCWLHYRNLFLLQAAGKEWCKENLVRITPTKDVAFL